MEDAEEALLAQVEQIIDDEQAVNTLMHLFAIGHRQASMALDQIRANLASSAARAGLPLPEFISRLDRERKIAVFGFCTGVVCQEDYDAGRDPITGDRKPGPEYQI